MKLSLVFIALLLVQNIYAQNNLWHVKAGENVKDALGDSVVYKYPQFTEGVVYFKDGTASHGNLNLNVFNGEMQFIKPSGDTLAMADKGLTKYIVIQQDTFYYNKVFIQSLYGNAIAKLGEIEIMRQVDLKKQGAYGQMSSTSAISSTNTYYSNNQFTKLALSEEVVFHKEVIYFIGDRFANFKPAYKKNILSMFNTNKTAIDTFIKNKDINLNRKDDLIKLVDFIQQIQK